MPLLAGPSLGPAPNRGPFGDGGMGEVYTRPATRGSGVASRSTVLHPAPSRRTYPSFHSPLPTNESAARFPESAPSLTSASCHDTSAHGDPTYIVPRILRRPELSPTGLPPAACRSSTRSAASASNHRPRAARTRRTAPRNRPIANLKRANVMHNRKRRELPRLSGSQREEPSPAGADTEQPSLLHEDPAHSSSAPGAYMSSPQKNSLQTPSPHAAA